MIKYDRFWETLKEKGISQYNLVKDYNISKSLLQRLRNNEGISTHSLDMLCSILDCRIEDIIEKTKRTSNPIQKAEYSSFYYKLCIVSNTITSSLSNICEYRSKIVCCVSPLTFSITGKGTLFFIKLLINVCLNS